METKDFVKGALLGAFAGAVGGILLAPKSGEDTRHDMTKTFNEMKEKVAHKIQVAEEFSKEMYERIVKETIESYETAKKITPEEAQKISEIFEKSFEDVEKILEKDAKKVVAAGKSK